MKDLDLVCPDCWFEFCHVKTEDIIMCPKCGYEFYQQESELDD